MVYNSTLTTQYVEETISLPISTSGGFSGRGCTGLRKKLLFAHFHSITNPVSGTCVCN